MDKWIFWLKGKPGIVMIENSQKFSLVPWAHWHEVILFNQPGKPVDNTYIMTSLIGQFREE
jgi:hypothetical protein